MRRLLPLLLVAACLPPETDEVWTPDHSDVGDDGADTDTLDTVDDTDVGDSDAPDCTPTPAPDAVSPSVLTGSSRLLLDQLQTYEAACLAIDDLDRDGRNDLVIAEAVGDDLEIELRRGASGGTLDLTKTTLTIPDGMQVGGCTLLDVDGDADLDVLLLTSRGVWALTLAGGALQDGGQVAALAPAEVAKERTPELIVPIDLDHQGGLDLVIGHHAILNDTCPEADAIDTGDVIVPPPAMDGGTLACFVDHGDGTFVAAPAGVCPSPMLTTAVVAPYGAEVADLDDDGDADLLVVSDFGNNRQYEGTPTGLVARDGLGLDVYNHAMGIALDDLDGDGARDAFVTDLGPSSLYVGRCGAWFDAGRALGLWRATRQTLTWGVQAVDLDANGASDLVVGVGIDASASEDPASMCIGPEGASTPHPPTMVLMNGGAARFTRYDVVDSTNPPARASGVPVRVAVGDLDGDLDPDVVVATGASTSILWNEVAQAGPLLRIRPVGADGLPAIGARVVVDQGDTSRVRDLWRSGGKSSVSEPVASFGYGEGGPATVRIRWPDGGWTTEGPFVPATREVVVRPR